MGRSYFCMWTAAVWTLSFAVCLGQTKMSEKEILAGAPQRIERYRKADAVIQVLNTQGEAVIGAEVVVEQTDHAFLFGCNAFPLLNYGDPKTGVGDVKKEELYQTRFTSLFNYATLGFYWGAYEPRPGQTNAERLRRQARWLREHGIVVKGHPLVWHEVYPAWGPSDPDAARERSRARVKDIVSRFAGLIDRWDVVNEATSSSRFENGIGRWVKRDGAAAVVNEALQWAGEANPGAFLLYNDYKLDADYEKLAEAVVTGKRPADALGIQSHMHGGEWPIERVWQVCETYSRFGKPLHFTEVTVLSGQHGWERKPWPTTEEGEKRQAEYVEKLYITLFSHPAVQAITWWDLMDGGWMGAPAGLVRADLSPKPAYHLLQKLIHETWRTRALLETGPDGTARFRGFLGRYRITVKTPTTSRTVAAELKPVDFNPITIRVD